MGVEREKKGAVHRVCDAGVVVLIFADWCHADCRVLVNCLMW